MGVEHLRKSEEKDEREKIIEEEDGAVPARQLEVDFEESEEGFHSLGSLVRPGGEKRGGEQSRAKKH